jgi:hypothetical protein
MDPGVKNDHKKACKMALYNVASGPTCIQHSVLAITKTFSLVHFRVANFDEFLISGSFLKVICCYLLVEEDGWILSFKQRSWVINPKLSPNNFIPDPFT